MTSQKACKQCKAIYSGAKCPKCGSEEFTETFKGKVVILRPEESVIAQKLDKKEKGVYTIKI
ncbi:MAG: transcription elongation factor subunit Spt4 [Nanoarchaeota archaeon]